MKVVFRTDASRRIGTGHVMRCLTLAQCLLEIGCEVIFLCKLHDGNLINKIKISGFLCLELSKPSQITSSSDDIAHANWLGTPQDNDANECQWLLQKIKPDWLVVDHYAIDFRWEKQIAPLCKKLMVIDDLTDRKHHCDLLLNQNVGVKESQYKDLVPEGCKLFIGPSYALLRSEFREWRRQSLRRRQEYSVVNHILVTLGGVDRENYTCKVLDQIAHAEISPHISVTVVMGSQSPHLNEVKTLAQSILHPANVVSDVDNMAELMSMADLVIGAPGSTSWERCCLGVPSILVIIADNQKHIADSLSQIEASVAVNSVTELHEILRNLVCDFEELRRLSSKSMRLVTGDGVLVVGNYMLTEL